MVSFQSQPLCWASGFSGGESYVQDVHAVWCMRAIPHSCGLVPVGTFREPEADRMALAM